MTVRQHNLTRAFFHVAIAAAVGFLLLRLVGARFTLKAATFYFGCFGLAALYYLYSLDRIRRYRQKMVEAYGADESKLPAELQERPIPIFPPALIICIVFATLTASMFIVRGSLWKTWFK